MKKTTVHIYIVLLSLIAGEVVTGQLLGFARLYTPWMVLICTLLFSGLFGVLLYKFSYRFLLSSLENPRKIQIPKWMSTVAVVAGVALLLVVLFLPLALWPYSGINHELNWDAGLYHLPKAAEMVVTHSSWDLSIAYGEYPYGFESLLAASLLISKGGYLIGMVSAIILLFFILSFFLITNRYSRIPASFVFFIVVFITASYDIIRLTSLNPFMIFRIMAFTIGKNDFFLTAAMIAFIFFAPIGPDKKNYNLIGLALTSMLIAATKPNGFPLLAFIWVLVLVYEINRWIKNKKIEKKEIALWVGILLINLSGLLWIIRNLAVQGTLISAESLHLQSLSILANLTNPLFTHHLGFNSYLIVVLMLAAVAAGILFKHVNWTVPAAFFVLVVTFVINPAVLYFGADQAPAVIFWRLGFYLLVFEIPLLFFLLDPAFHWILDSKNRTWKTIINSALVAGMAFTSILGCVVNFSRLKMDQANTLVLRDQYTSPVGVDGYFSAYDYIQKNVTHSTVWIENGLPFYLFGKDLTNSISRQKPADYYVFLQTNWIGMSGYPAEVDSPAWLKEWSLVYSDSEGRVYKRIQ